jgi:hypothetical protein
MGDTDTKYARLLDDIRQLRKYYAERLAEPLALVETIQTSNPEVREHQGWLKGRREANEVVLEKLNDILDFQQARKQGVAS